MVHHVLVRRIWQGESKRSSLYLFFDLDDLYWLPNWKIRSKGKLVDLVEQKTSADEWIVSGNNSETRLIIWTKADTVVFLNYSFMVCFWRCFKRTLRGLCNKEEICNGNRDSFSRAFFSENSIFLYFISSYFKQSKKYSKLIKDPRYKHINFIEFTSPRQAEEWLKSL